MSIPDFQHSEETSMPKEETKPFPSFMMLIRRNSLFATAIRSSETDMSKHRSRYYCKDCHHSFVSSIHTIYYRGRLGQHKVRSMLDSLVVDTTVVGAAKETGVSKYTSLRYRHMLLKYVEKADKKPVLSGEGVQVDETYKTLSGMVGHEKKKKGISSQKEAICIGTDCSGRIFLKDLKDGHPTMQSLKNTWSGYIANGSVITHEKLHDYSGAFNVLVDNKEITVRATEPKEEKALEHLNHLVLGSSGS